LIFRYGAAGAEIIQRNLGLSGGSTIETFSAGRNIDAVFAFCDIRKFTNTTEVRYPLVHLITFPLVHVHALFK